MATIADVYRKNVNEDIEVLCTLADKKVKSKANGDKYAVITIRDETGKISFVIWDDISKAKDIEIGSDIVVSGKVNRYKDEVQIKNAVIKPSENIKKTIPIYQISQENLKYFNGIIDSLESRYKEFAIAVTGARGYNEERWNEFTQCVAGEKYYGYKQGGLFLHTVGVIRSLEAIINNYLLNPFHNSLDGIIVRDRVIVKALLHDYMKTKVYEYKNAIRRKPMKVDHIVLGVIYASEINKEIGNVFSEDELENIQYSILSQYGHFGKYELITIEDKLLHFADMIDSQISIEVESKTKQ